jgi:hypothetical protein
MLYEMKKQQFDIGIGGLARADTYLFRFLNIPYIRVALEDVEASTMQLWLDMPVLMSSYPSALV